MMYPLKNAVTMSHLILEPYAAQAKTIVDMTCGNGHDTLFLASHMPEDATLYAFDIQRCAIEATQKRLETADLSHKRVIYQEGSHDILIENLTDTPDIIVFNLGYLPSGDHQIHTKSEITIKAVKICLNKLAINGIIMLAAYPGTPTGKAEADAVHQFLQTVPQQDFDVSAWQPINQVHYPPVLYMMQKRG